MNSQPVAINLPRYYKPYRLYWTLKNTFSISVKMNKITKEYIGANYLVNDYGILIPAYLTYKKREKCKLIIMYQTFKDLFPHLPNNELIMEEEFNEFWIEDVLQVLAKINYILAPTHYQNAPYATDKFAREFLDEKAYQNYSRLRLTHKAITRQQLLANTKLAFLHCSKIKTKKSIAENKSSFGRLLFRVSDYLEEYTPYKSKYDPTVEERQKLLATISRNINFNETQNFNNALIRYWYIFNKIAVREKRNKTQKCLLQYFRGATKLDYNLLIAVAFAIWGFYCESNRNKRLSTPEEYMMQEAYFDRIKSSSKKNLKRTLEFISGDQRYYTGQYKKTNYPGKYFKFKPFWEKPLLRNNRGLYYLLDFEFLEERITGGSYWMIHDHLFNKNKNEAGKFSGYWGDVFEGYVRDLIKSVYDSSRLAFEEDATSPHGIDAHIYYGNCLVCLEITKSGLRYDSWISGDYEKIKRGLRKVLIKDGKTKGKVAKMYELIGEMKSKKMSVGDFNLPKVEKYIPIVVFEKPLPVSTIIWEEYENLLIENGITDPVFLSDLEFWSVQELEMVLRYIQENKKTTIPELLAHKKATGFHRESMKNYLTTKKDFPKQGLHFHKLLFDEAMKNINDELFNLNDKIKQT